MPNPISLKDAFNLLTTCEIDFFYTLNEKEFEACEKIAELSLQLEESRLQDIQIKIHHFKSKTIKPGISLIPDEKLQIVYKKFHPEKSVEGGSLDNLPIEILAQILIEGAGFDTNLVSKKCRDIFLPQVAPNETSVETNTKLIQKDRIWKGIAERMHCPPLSAELGKLDEEIKKYCLEYVKEIAALPEITADVAQLLKGSITIEKMSLLKEWRDARDTIIVWKTLASLINLPGPMRIITYREEMIEKAKEFPKWIQENKALLSSVQHLNLYGKNLAFLPSEICYLQLTSMILGNNNLITLPSEIGSLGQLRILRLGNNKIKTLPAEICKLGQLEYLDLDNNKLTTLPHEIGSLGLLFSLELQNNKINELPLEICSLNHLSYLFLGDNDLKVLPPEIGSLTQLRSLRLVNNKLNALPPQIRSLGQLQFLSLSKNNLIELPPEIGFLTSLEELLLNENKLTDVPLEIGNLQQLRHITLSKNKLPSTIGLHARTLARIASYIIGAPGAMTEPSAFEQVVPILRQRGCDIRL